MKTNEVMYWKEGFYDTPREGAVEITVDYWHQLLDGQNSGRRIVTDENGYPVLLDAGPNTVEEWRNQLIEKITAYDKSDAVNCFYVNGLPMWLDRDTRTSLARTFAVDEAAGDTACSIWYEGPPPVRFDIPITHALPMLNALERYAKETYNVTQGHVAAVYRLTLEELTTYDFETGYPDKLEFNF